MPPEMWLLPYSGWTGIGWAHPGRFWCHCRMVGARSTQRAACGPCAGQQRTRWAPSACIPTAPRMPLRRPLHLPCPVALPLRMQVYLPMSYAYGRRATAPPSPLTEALRQELYPLPYGQINWNKARCVRARVRGRVQKMHCQRGAAAVQQPQRLCSGRRRSSTVLR